MPLPDPQQSRAFLFGTGTYASPDLIDVQHVGNNLTALRDALTDSRIGGLRSENCVVMADPESTVGLARELTRCAREADDMFLVYYAGHGITSVRRRELYLGLPESDYREIGLTAFPFDRIRQAMDECTAANRVLILDCCYSGHAAQGSLGYNDQQVLNQISLDGTFTLTSAPANSPALYDIDGEFTAFTGMLLDILTDGIADGPELLSLNEIYRWLRRAATARGFPEPQRLSTGTTDLLALARNRAYRPLTEPPAPVSSTNPANPAGTAGTAEPAQPDPGILDPVRELLRSARPDERVDALRSLIQLAERHPDERGRIAAIAAKHVRERSKDRAPDSEALSPDVLEALRVIRVVGGANITLSEARLSGADLSDMNLYGASLDGADLRHADLSGADLRRASFVGADLSSANLEYARLEQTDVRAADLTDASTVDVAISELHIDPSTKLNGDLEEMVHEEMRYNDFHRRNAQYPYIW
ncbi:MAG: caspase, EACC1-associated type [Catenulispora sp.]